MLRSWDAELAPFPNRWHRAARVAFVTAVGAGVMASLQIANPLGLTLLVSFALPEFAFSLATGVAFLIAAAAIQMLALATVGALVDSPVVQVCVFIAFAAVSTYLIYGSPKLGRLWLWIQIPAVTAFYMVLFDHRTLGWDNAQMFAGIAIAVALLWLFNNVIWPEPAASVLASSLQNTLARSRRRLSLLIAIFLGDSSPNQDRGVASKLAYHLMLLHPATRNAKSTLEPAELLAAVMVVERIHNEIDRLGMIACNQAGAACDDGEKLDLREAAAALERALDAYIIGTAKGAHARPAEARPAEARSVQADSAIQSIGIAWPIAAERAEHRTDPPTDAISVQAENMIEERITGTDPLAQAQLADSLELFRARVVRLQRGDAVSQAQSLGTTMNETRSLGDAIDENRDSANDPRPFGEVVQRLISIGDLLTVDAAELPRKSPAEPLRALPRPVFPRAFPLNKFLVRFCARHTVAMTIAFLAGLFDNNAAIHAALWLLMIGGPPSHGATVKKFTVRAIGASGALIFAALATIVLAPNFTILPPYIGTIFIGVLLIIYVGEGGGELSYLVIGATAFVIAYSGPGPRLDIAGSIWTIWGISLGMIIRAIVSAVSIERPNRTLAEEVERPLNALVKLAPAAATSGLVPGGGRLREEEVERPSNAWAEAMLSGGQLHGEEVADVGGKVDAAVRAETVGGEATAAELDEAARAAGEGMAAGNGAAAIGDEVVRGEVEAAARDISAGEVEVIAGIEEMLSVAADAQLQGPSAGIDARNLVDALDTMRRLAFALGNLARAELAVESTDAWTRRAREPRVARATEEPVRSASESGISGGTDDQTRRKPGAGSIDDRVHPKPGVTRSTEESDGAGDADERARRGPDVTGSAGEAGFSGSPDERARLARESFDRAIRSRLESWLANIREQLQPGQLTAAPLRTMVSIAPASDLLGALQALKTSGSAVDLAAREHISALIRMLEHQLAIVSLS